MDPSLPGVVDEPTSGDPDDVLASVGSRLGVEIEPAAHPESTPARRQPGIFLVD
jgi:hypothetical protein